MATGLVSGGWQNSTSHRSKISSPINQKFGTVYYVHEVTPCANLSMGAFRQMLNITNIFSGMYTFFIDAPA